jgi:acyl phosphate:glycerol-3-phosphate acyltransferase
MTDLWAALALSAGAYMLGSVPFGLVVARAKGVDLRAVGSGNIGATNVARALGKKWAVLVLLADAAKGFVPVTLGRKLSLSPGAVALAGICAIVGHMFTVFLRGKGGKGVATSLGVALALSPISALIGFAVYVVVFGTTRLSSLGSLLGVWTFSVYFSLGGEPFGLGIGPPPAWPYVALALGGAALVTLRHRENLARLVRGEEKKT